MKISKQINSKHGRQLSPQTPFHTNLSMVNCIWAKLAFSLFSLTRYRFLIWPLCLGFLSLSSAYVDSALGSS